MKYLIIFAAAALLACSSHPDPAVTRAATPLVDCFTPVQAGNVTGFGFNGQPRNLSLSGGANVRGALDMLVNDFGATFARVEVFDGESDWEATQDNADPNVFDWSYYDAVFSAPRFQRLWAYVAYLNQLGIAHVELAQHGGLPAWMGTTGSQYRQDGRAYVLPQSQEDEFVETCVAMMLYARTRAPQPRPHFDLFSPWNEPEFATLGEGIDIADTQRARVLRKLTDRMNALPDLAGIQLVVGEDGSEPGMIITRQAVQNDAVVMARTAATSYHRYGDASAQVFGDWRGSTPPVWITEENSTWLSACYDATWGMGLEAAGNLLLALQNGATAGLVWSDFDAVHEHQSSYQTFGILSTTSGGRNGTQLCNAFTGQPSDAVLDAMTYAPKPTYYALRPITKWLRPNAAPLTVSASGGVQAVAYKNADGTVVVAGRSSSAVNSTITLTTSNPPSYLTPRVSVSGSYDVIGSAVPLTSGQGTFSLPAQSVFTLLSNPGDGSGGSGGQGGMSAGGNAGAAPGGNGGQSAGNGGNSGGVAMGGNAGDSAGMSGGSGAPSGGQSGSSAGGQSGAGGMTGGAGQGGAGTSSGGAGAGGAGAAGAAGAAGSGGSAPTLVAAWAFNEGSGTTTADASGHGHTGTINGATWTTTGCKYGACLSFPGTSGKNVTTPDANDLDLGTAFTIMAWVKPTTTSGWRPVLIKENGTNKEAYLLYSNPSNQGAYFTDSNNTEWSLTASGNVSTSAWSHVAMVRSVSHVVQGGQPTDIYTLSLWLNGVQIGSSQVGSALTATPITVTTSSGILAIGGHTFWSGEWFSGLLDNVAVYGSALSAAEIAAAMGVSL